MAPKPAREKVKLPDRITVASSESQGALLATLSELLFILLPFVVLGLVSAFSHSGMKMLRHPEWSVASALLFGDTSMKLIRGVAKTRSEERATFVATGGLVLGFAPSIVVLVMMQLSEENPAGWLVFTQDALFVVATCYFLAFRWIGELIHRREAALQSVDRD